jgi:hypothetical protein
VSLTDQKLCAWGGWFFVACFGPGLALAHFIPPPAPTMSADEVAAFYTEHAGGIRLGMILGLLGLTGWGTLVGAISAQMSRMRTTSSLGRNLQLGAGMIGLLTVMLPIMIFGAIAFRPDRDPAVSQGLNDLGWLIIIPAFPTFLAQFLGLAVGTLTDRSPRPVYPRWVAYFNIWVGLAFVPGGIAYFFKSGPFSWNGLFAFWVAAGAFFIWLLVMPWVTVRSINESDAAAEKAPEPLLEAQRLDRP